MNDIQKACKILEEGGVVGMPTETVYGLAGSIKSETGINNIFATKERPFFDPLIVHVSSIDQAKEYVESWPRICDVLASELWPGPVTFILKKNERVSSKITSGLDTVGIRMPKHPMAQDLIRELGHPVAAPSANKFKKTSPTTAEHVQSEFPELLVLEGGSCEIGIESTIIGIMENEVSIFRPGMITAEKIQDILAKNNIEQKVSYKESPVAPGHLKHHYMPNSPIILKLNDQVYDNSHIAEELLSSTVVWSLPESSSIAARELYGKFRELDHQNKNSITIEITKAQYESEEFKGILNRLIKAASFALPKELSNKA